MKQRTDAHKNGQWVREAAVAFAEKRKRVRRHKPLFLTIIILIIVNHVRYTVAIMGGVHPKKPGCLLSMQEVLEQQIKKWLCLTHAMFTADVEKQPASG